MNETKYEHIVHPFPPLYNSESRILILGSLPSVKSREQMFFYGHPQNRFWKMISGVFKEAVPQTIEEKKAFMRWNLSRGFSAKHNVSENSVQNICRAVSPQRMRIIGSMVFFYL